ncbi:MAG: S41 family peptidase [Acidobacteriota bacterium]
MNRRSLSMGFAIAMAALARSAFAADSSAALTANRAREIATEAADSIDRMYVSPDVGRKIAESLRARSAAGDYDTADSPSRLAELLSRDLQEVGNDRHLSVRVDHSGSGGSVIRRIDRGPAPAGAHGAGGTGPPLRIRREGPAATGSSDLKRRTNFGFRAVERLDGNVGLVDIREFVPLGLSRETAAAAMAFLSTSDAIVVDLRECPGGAPDVVSFLASYFFGPERKELFSRYDRPMDEKTTEYTVENLPGRRMPDTDLWILVGPNTASAGESFAYLLQQFGRATVVGEKTAGAGHNNVMLPIGEGLVLSVSVARPIHPRTGKGWEGTGVQPDIRTSSADARDTAHAAALHKLLDRAADPRLRRELAWAVERVESRGRALQSEAELQAYAGRYGERQVTVENGRLVCRTASGRARALISVAADAFSWDELTRATFERDRTGRPARLLLESADGGSEIFARDDSPRIGAQKETQ